MKNLFTTKTLVFLTRILAGNLILAFGIAVFIIPLNLVSGGVTGVALFLHHLLSIPVSTLLLTINILMFFLGWAIMGRTFAMGTLLSSLLYPTALRFMEGISLLNHGNCPKAAGAILGGICVGIGVGLVFRAGASTGGTDPIPLALNKYLHLPLGISMYLVDSCIILLQLLFTGPSAIFYGILFVMASSPLVGKVASLQLPIKQPQVA